MNKTKRGLQLGAAITSIVLGAIMAVGALFIVLFTNDLGAAIGADEAATGAALSLIKTAYIIAMLFCVAVIVVSALICRKPGENYHKGLCIADLVLNIILAVLYISSSSWWAVLPIIISGLFIATLCINPKAASSQTPDVAPAAQNDEVAKD